MMNRVSDSMHRACPGDLQGRKCSLSSFVEEGLVVLNMKNLKEEKSSFRKEFFNVFYSHSNPLKWIGIKWRWHLYYLIQSWCWFSFAAPKSSPFDLQTEAALLFLSLLVLVPPPAAAAILLWQREEKEFIAAAADVKGKAAWRLLNGHKRLQGPRAEGAVCEQD